MRGLQRSYSHANFWSKIFLSVALLITTSTSTTILALSVRQDFNHGSLVVWVQQSRATIQIIVHILSATLAAMQLYVLSGFICFRTNLELLSKPMSLNSLKLHQALNYRRLDYGLPLRASLIIFVWLAIVEIPGALWAGAISPVLTTANVASVYRVPFWNKDPSATWNQACRPAVDCDWVSHNVTDQGTFTNVPWKCKFKPILPLGESES